MQKIKFQSGIFMYRMMGVAFKNKITLKNNSLHLTQQHVGGLWEKHTKSKLYIFQFLASLDHKIERFYL